MITLIEQNYFASNKQSYYNSPIFSLNNMRTATTFSLLLILLILVLGSTNANSQTLKLENTKWKSQSFWGYGYGIGSEIYTENTKDPYNNFEFLIEFDKQNFVSTNLTLEQSDVKQIKGKYHIFSNNYIQLVIDTVLCIKPNEPCKLTYKSYYNQVHKYWYKDDGKIEFQNTHKRADDWMDKIVGTYIQNATNEKVLKAKSENYYIEWLPTETKKIKGNSYTILKIVYEVNKNEKDFDIETLIQKYKLLNILYIQLPSQKIFEKNNKGKLEEWKP